MILIRADAHGKTATGHIMRCLSIAHAFSDAGHDVMFVIVGHRGDGLIHQSGFTIEVQPIKRFL